MSISELFRVCIFQRVSRNVFFFLLQATSYRKSRGPNSDIIVLSSEGNWDFTTQGLGAVVRDPRSRSIAIGPAKVAQANASNMDESVNTPSSLKQEGAESTGQTLPAINPSIPENTATTNDLVPSTEGRPHLALGSCTACLSSDCYCCMDNFVVEC